MPVLPKEVSKAWEEKEGPIVFTTIDENNIPNSIYATCVSKYDEENIIVANNFFSKTLENILTNSSGSILFITKNKASYQIKGSIEYHTEGPIFDNMKSWNPKTHPGHAAAVIKVEEVFKGSEKLL